MKEEGICQLFGDDLGTEGNSTHGFTPDSCGVTAISENQNHPERSTMLETAPVCNPTTLGAPCGTKMKREMPRLNEQDVNEITLSPMPISASVPLVGDYSSATDCRPKKQPILDPVKRKQKHVHANGNGGSGSHFTPHVLTVEAGEDVSKTIISFSGEGTESRAICILSASGSISNVALRHPNSSGGTSTFEGQFEILTLNGSFRPIVDGVTKSRTGGMSISLSDSNGLILGGGLAGYLVAAGPVQVVIASFSIDNQLEQEMKQNNDSAETGIDESYYD